MPSKKTARRLDPAPTQSDGPATDANNAPVVDPTDNVVRLVNAANLRQDDLRLADARFHAAEIECTKEISALRAMYDEKLRNAEAARIDAIRAVDVGNVSRAAEVVAAQQQVLATQLTTTAETMRTTVAAADVAARQTLGAALEPIQKDVSELRRIQFEQQGAKVAQRDDRDVRGSDRDRSQWLIGVGVGIALFVASEFIKRGGA